MPKETVGLKIDIDSRSVATAARRSDDLARSSENVGAALGGMARAAAAVGVAATAAVAGVVAMTMKIAEQADEIAKNSTRIGVSIESYQELEHAMDLSGGSIGEASAAIRRLSGNMLDASQGVSTAVDAFAGLGIETTTAAGGLRSVDDVLADIADEFAAMEDGSLKTARAMELFGRSGATLIPLLNQGSEGIAEMRQEAHDLGIVITDETAAAAEALNDDLTRLRGLMAGLAVKIASELIPRLREVVGSLTNLAMRAGESNANFERLARVGLNAMIDALVIVAQVSIRVTQGVLGLRQAWLEMKESALDYLDIFRPGGHDEEIIEGQIAAIQETVGNLEVLHGSIGALGNSPGPRELSKHFSDMASAAARATALAQALTPDPDPRPTAETVRELDKFELAAKNSSAALVELRAHQLSVADGMRRIVAEAREAIKVIAEDKSAEEAMLQKQQLIQDQAKALAEASAHVQKETVDMGDKFTQLGKLGSSAFGGLVKGFQDLSLAALWKKDGNALKEFGKSLGKMLIQLGTMAIAYAAVAALGAVFPALQPLVGSPAGAPALLAAGAGALAAGAVLGAAIPRGGKGGAKPSEGGGGEPRSVSTTNVYNVAFDSFSPPRSRSRAVLESIGSAVAEGA